MRKLGMGLVAVAALLSGCSSSTALKARVTAVEQRVTQLEESSTQQQIEALEMQQTMETTRTQAIEAARLATIARDLAAGSARKEEVRRVTVYFDHSSSILTEDAQKMIDGVAEELLTNPQMAACVIGYTDASGDPKFNDWLAERRGEKVRQALVSRMGVDVLRVASVGLGATRPIADNETPDGRKQNRRVEISLVRPQTTVDAQVSQKNH